ncbi:Lrp/AsnC family transcriptional regulator, leucine-responsive regulatory protein [Thermoflavimicrobium dichotomicum]|uniref:Lrp/AsnC family transcriptional regulator, leucine-responsive regulatory protein n=1 Tax=Thermoflavimicrobium dichotomicum TaxID=46223 RepID=A0A1I3T3D0_9BACL|nr:Lrp/AsnC family transcriptional regulator, leucine-responsive regulatory protein [Thermoflavimicrobium dichotomicum]
MKVQVNSHYELNQFLEEILQFGNYRVNSPLKK